MCDNVCLVIDGLIELFCQCFSEETLPFFRRAIIGNVLNYFRIFLSSLP